MSKISPGRLVLAVALLALCTVLGSISALAQSAVTGAVSGSVSDPNKAAVPNATISLKDLGTNKEETATSGADGRFRITNLAPGAYTVTVKASGFADYKRETVIVEVGRTSTLDIDLGISGTQATVDVIGTSVAVNTESKEFASNINQTAINELPINGRRWSNFVILTPGVVPDGSFGLLSFRGISGLLNNNTVDGGDNNQAFFGEERWPTRISYSISQSAIREFQVNTSNYSAEYGRAAGGVTNAVTEERNQRISRRPFLFPEEQ
jgi:hypothetical protein